MTKSQRTLQHNGNTIDYELKRSNRKTLGITVYPDLRVVVRAPRKLKIAEIEIFLQSRGDWMLKHLAKYAEQAPPPAHEYVEGEDFLFLGEKYPLCVIEEPERRRAFAKIGDDALYLYIPVDADFETRQRAIELWYRREARECFAVRLDECYPLVEPLGIPYPEVRIKNMKTRWGSCSGRADRINLNIKLMQTPLICIDYVILHELCHFIERNHSSRYYALLASVEPEWKALRKLLNSYPVV